MHIYIHSNLQVIWMTAGFSLFRYCESVNSWTLILVHILMFMKCSKYMYSSLILQRMVW